MYNKKKRNRKLVNGSDQAGISENLWQVMMCSEVIIFLLCVDLASHAENSLLQLKAGRAELWKNPKSALTTVVQLIVHHSTKQNFTVRFLVRTHACIAGTVRVGLLWEAINWCFSLTSMFPSLPLSLSPFPPL